MLYKKIGLLCAICILTLYTGCSLRPVPEKLPLSVRSTLNLLQPDPQFIMYFNFKQMRSAGFWKKNVSDSLLGSEKTFGSVLNIFKQATGVSISGGLDEMYYSNSWYGENSIVMKGVFSKEKLDAYVAADTTFIKKFYNGVDLYQKADNGLYFFMKDNITICASNFMSRIDAMLAVKDTSVAGVLTNEAVMKAIDNAMYKNNLWMVTTEKMFIRGILMNFAGGSGEINNDTAQAPPADEKLNPDNLYKRINSITFSAQMKDDLGFMVQCESINEESASYLKKILTGYITVSKIAASENTAEGSSLKDLLNSISIDEYGNEVQVEIEVNEKNINAIREKSILNKPE